MRTISHRKYRFWFAAFSFPAMIPLFLDLAFNYFVRDDLEAALGPQGSHVGLQISTALMVTFLVLMPMAALLAWVKAAKGDPETPGAAEPSPEV